MKDSLVNKKESCCGCGSCALVCPVQAIQMVPMELGCLYPQIDERTCIQCGKCEQVCVYRTDRSAAAAPPQAYAAVSKDRGVLDQAASGGVFGTVARSVVSSGGAVFGCAMEQAQGILTPRHICVEDHESLRKLQGSKYVQSELGDSFLHIKALLRQGRTVLFSGTPCQVDALKHFLRGEDTSCLYTIDLICHGVPSKKLFQEYLALLKRKIVGFKFRDKDYEWGLHASYTYEDKTGRIAKKALPTGLSSYYSFFLSSESYRESCYSCRYANMNRVGDITIGDCWGIEKEYPECLAENGGRIDMAQGVSAVLVNTAKGQALLDTFGQELFTTEADPEKIAKWNHQLCAPSAHSDVRYEIIKQYDTLGYAGVEKQFRSMLGSRYYVRLLRAFCKD